MNLYINGCSHTYGDDLQDKKTAWPYLLSKKLQADIIYNDSEQGNSNENILADTIKAVSGRAKIDLVIIAWSYIDRFTRTRLDTRHLVHFNNQLSNSLYKNNYEYNTYAKLHYSYWTDYLNNFIIWLQQIMLLQSFLREKNINYLFLNASSNNINEIITSRDFFNDNIRKYTCIDRLTEEALTKLHQEIQSYYTTIDMNKYYFFESFSIADLDTQFPTGETNHLLEEGHYYIANELFEKLTKVYNI